MKLLKEIAHEYATMTRKNKCIPSTRKKGVRSKKEKSATKKRVQFSNTNTAPAPVEEPIEEPVVEPEPVEEEVKENPFETEPEPEETEGEINPIDDGLNPST